MIRNNSRYRTIHRSRRRAVACCTLGLSFLLWLAFVPGVLHSKRLAEHEVRRAAETYARTVTRDARPDAFVIHMEPYAVDGEIVAYIAHLGGGGYCLCGADDLVLPVYLYTPSGTYDPRNPANECILWEIGERTRLYRSWEEQRGAEYLTRGQAIEERTLLWRELSSGQIPSRVIRNRERAAARDRQRTSTRGDTGTPLAAPAADPDMMAIDFTPKWGQGSVYNDMCPQLLPGSGNCCVTGCVATASAQVMYHWKWPETGQGTESIYYHYRWRPVGDWDEEPLATDPEITDGGGWTWAGRLEWVPTSGGRLRMSGDWDGSIKWAALDTNFVQNITPDYETALDALYSRMNHDSTYHFVDFAAASYDWSIMQNYHSDPVDPGDEEVAKLSYHAGVGCETSYGLRGSSSNAPLAEYALKSYFRYDPDAVTVAGNITVITEEIMWLRPVEIGGCYHMWVIHGYDKSTDPDRLFLRNMGWYGSGDGWYTVDDWCFIGYTEHVVLIAPLNVVRFVGDTDPGAGSPSDPHMNLNEALMSAPDGATLIFKAGTVNEYLGSELVISRPMTLMGEDVTIYAVPVE